MRFGVDFFRTVQEDVRATHPKPRELTDWLGIEAFEEEQPGLESSITPDPTPLGLPSTLGSEI